MTSRDYQRPSAPGSAPRGEERRERPWIVACVLYLVVALVLLALPASGQTPADEANTLYNFAVSGYGSSSTFDSWIVSGSDPCNPSRKHARMHDGVLMQMRLRHLLNPPKRMGRRHSVLTVKRPSRVVIAACHTRRVPFTPRTCQVACTLHPALSCSLGLPRVQRRRSCQQADPREPRSGGASLQHRH